MKEHLSKVWKFIIDTMSGMVYGLFATLIIGVIINQLGLLVNYDMTLFGLTFNPGTTIIAVATVVKSLVGVGIGVGIGLVYKKEALKLISLAVAGGIATSTLLFSKSDPLVAYFVVIFTMLLIDLIFKKKTPFDIIVIPLLSILFASVFSYILFTPITWFATTVGEFTNNVAAVNQPFLMGVLLSVLMGVLLTSPLSSAAIAISFSIGGIAGGAALIGCVVHMLGFAIMGRKANSIGVTISVAIGTSMLQFKNTLKKPILWLPPIIVSAILGPFSTLVFKMQVDPIGSGMGTSGLVGQFATYAAMGNTPMTWVSIFVFQFAMVIPLMFLVDFIFKKYKLYSDEDLVI
ncbi:MAG: PTS sugar transporter subunit IIC [Bacilli bacterium]|nr:PTS sugar transporter subunit IIC [Bacilli bacterium]